MGYIRKAFRVKNTVMHPVHTATRPVRRAVRKAVLPKSVRKVSYKTRTVSTALHNPVSATFRALDSDSFGSSRSTQRTSTGLRGRGYRSSSYGSSSRRYSYSSYAGSTGNYATSYEDTYEDWHRDAAGHAQVRASDGTYYTPAFDPETDEYIPYTERTYEDCVTEAEETYKRLERQLSESGCSEQEKNRQLQELRNTIEIQKKSVYPKPESHDDANLFIGIIIAIIILMIIALITM